MIKKITIRIAIFCFNFSFVGHAQTIEWMSKLYQVKNYKEKYENNTIQMITGPANVYPGKSLETVKYDDYADGYILLPSNNRNLMVDGGFHNPRPVNHVVVCGVFNEGVIKKVVLILKDYKLKTIYSSEKSILTKKKAVLDLKFQLETVYGVRIIVDESKINKWNLIKGIGICKTDEQHVKIHPDEIEWDHKHAKQILPPDLNSKDCNDYNPRFSLDGSVMYFVRDCNDQFKEDIWVSNTKLDGNWVNPYNIGKPYNNHDNNSILATTLKGKHLYVGNVYKNNGEKVEPGISVSTKSDDGIWGLPEAIHVPTIHGLEYVNYYVDIDQEVMLLTAEDINNVANWDLYVTHYNKHKKEWETPISLGHHINTEFTEDFPFLGTDGKTLFFSSNGQIGYGNYDIYMSQKLDHSWTNWSKPKNLGPMVNTKTNDFGFGIAPTGDMAYYASISTVEPNHHADIYKIKLPKKLRQPAITPIRGKVTSSRTGAPVVSEIKFRPVGSQHFDHTKFTSDKDGNYTVLLHHGKVYEIAIETDNFFKLRDTLALNDTVVNHVLVKNFKLDPYLDSGQVSVLDKIQFKFGTSFFTPESQSGLEKLLKTLREQKNMVVEIAGHTDSDGTDSFNLKLSNWRADAVSQYLIQNGISKWRLKSKGYGEVQPIATNDTDEGKALNRRVEMTVILQDFTAKYKKKKPEKDKKDVSKATLKKKESS